MISDKKSGKLAINLSLLFSVYQRAGSGKG
jgi:hypothetical protein